MHFTKPAWVQHRDSSTKADGAKRLSIFSVHVHPDGSRIATGGLDAKIRIWSTKPILSKDSEDSGRPPKALCTLTMHTGPVLTVRWAHSGRWLASGSDDAVVMIWDLDPNARGKIWGTDEVNIEGWKPLKRLPGHDSDVTDVAWSPGDRYLASVGLDSAVIIWCGFTLERLRKLDQHQGFVKGVCWDPVGEFLATQSDDRSVKIWKTTDWSLEAEVTKPFEDSPGSTFFRRLSWSPDGAHITASNATNNKGFVFIAAVITRNSWTSDISLVGHENTIEAAAYNPHIFLRNPALPVATSNICSVVALGADDRSVSVWQTKSARPLIVAKEVFERQIMDLSWSWDGLTLYAASSDGTIAVFDFDTNELEGIAPLSVQDQYLAKFGFVAPPLPPGYSHNAPSQVTPVQQQNGFTQGGSEHVNVLIAKRGPKKRANLTNNNLSIPSAGQSEPFPYPRHQQHDQSAHHTTTSSHFFPPPEEQPFGHIEDTVMVPSDSYAPPAKKRKMSDMNVDDNRVYFGKTMGTERSAAAPIPIPGPSTEWRKSPIASSSSQNVLPALPLMTRVTAEVEDSPSRDIVEANNPANGGTSEVLYVSGNTTLWLDYVPSPVLAVHATKDYCAAAMQDGSVNVYSHSGRRIMPALFLGSSLAHIDGVGPILSIVTREGQLYSWKVTARSSVFPPISIASIMRSGPSIRVLAISVQTNGVPILNCSDGVMYSYDSSITAWVKLSEKWWAEGSDVWPGRQRVDNGSRNPVAWLEGNIQVDGQNAMVRQRPEWWNTVMTLGHLETRLHACRLLDSPTEYRQCLAQYATKIADEGFRTKGEELIKELFGPVYWNPGRDRSEEWSPTVVGLSKRDLLKDVLSHFSRSNTLGVQKLAADWQDLMKKMTHDEV